MKKRTVTTLSILAALGLGLTGSLPADASTSPLRLSYAHPNSYGSDRGSAWSLDDEWVKVTNYSYTSSYTLTGYTLKDRAGHTYKFPTFHLSPRTNVVVHTGSGTNSSTNLYWGSGWYVWNNAGDEAYLRTSSGSLNSTCTWGAVADGVTVHC